MGAVISSSADSSFPWGPSDNLSEVLHALEKSLDEDGAPRRIPVHDWWPMLADLDRIRKRHRTPWPDAGKELARGLLLAAMRFSRPDGSSVLTPDAAPDDRAGLVRRWAEFLDDPAVGKVSRWWFGRKGARLEDAAPPLPAWASGSQPLAMLRSDWLAQGDFVAIDHRSRGSVSLLEIQAQGKPLIGPRWTATGEGPASVARQKDHRSSPMADWCEWSFRLGATRIVRTAVFLRGRSLALLADERHSAEASAEMRLEFDHEPSVTPVKDSRALAIKAPGVSARVLPLALPALPYATDRGSWRVEGDSLVLQQRAEARRIWMPLLVSWDRGRNRRVATWRTLTVTQKSKVCPPGVAFAARVSWGPGDGLVVYRSLARPAMRVFLGHQTTSRFLIGLFDANGNVTPLLKVD